MSALAASTQRPAVSHNLVGQRLGPKGRGTRERILAATERMLGESGEINFSLSAVAREASLGMTTLYLYFSDLTELLLAVLEPIMASAEKSYVGHLRKRWPDEDLGAHCMAFVASYHAFWKQHTRILHLRNSFADANDARMRAYRIQMSRPLMQLVAGQMDGDRESPCPLTAAMATVLLTGIERLVTVTTDVNFTSLLIDDPAGHIRNLLQAEARLLELGIRDLRQRRANGQE